MTDNKFVELLHTCIDIFDFLKTVELEKSLNHIFHCISIRHVMHFFLLLVFCLQTGKLLKESDPETGHQKVITSMAKSADGSHFITGSHDKTAKLWDIRTLKVLKSYSTERPVNAAAISPLLDHVCTGYSLTLQRSEVLSNVFLAG